MKRLLILVLAALAATGSLRAQGLESVRVGARLRVMLRDSSTPLIGTLEAQQRDTLWIDQTEGGTTGVPLARLKRVEISRGARGHAGTGAIIGFLVGAAIAVPTGLSCDCNKGAAVPLFTLLLGGLGTAAGAGLGSAMKSEAWQAVEFLPPRVAPAVASPGVVLRLRVFP